MEPCPLLSPSTGHQFNSLVRSTEMATDNERNTSRRRKMEKKECVESGEYRLKSFFLRSMFLIPFGSINRNDTLWSGSKGSECHLISYLSLYVFFLYKSESCRLDWLWASRVSLALVLPLLFPRSFIIAIRGGSEFVGR